MDAKSGLHAGLHAVIQLSVNCIELHAVLVQNYKRGTKYNINVYHIIILY